MPRAAAVPAADHVNDFRMPSLGADMEFGTLVRWHVKPGEHVQRDAIIAEVETEKGVFSVESPVDGVVAALAVAEGTKVPVGTVLATFGAAAATTVAPAIPPAAPAPAPAPPPAAAKVVPSAPAPPAPALSPRLRASPVARKRAAELGVDLAALWRDERDHAITLAEVERAAVPPPSAPRAPADDAKAAMRRAVSAAVSRANREIPHYYLSTSISLRRALAWLQNQNATRPVDERVLPAALLLKAVATALGEYPNLNGYWIDGAAQPSATVHLGVAISLRGGGLIAPAIHDAGARTLAEMMDALRDLVRRAREGGLRGSEMTDATVTVTNLGDEGVETVFGVIYPPQLALIGFGKIAERPWAEAGMLGVHPVVTATLAADHRATDGHYGGRFVAALDRLLQAPETL
ncbi:MAG TPA: dihydrolipoamide acetyltransferase family protein [Gemmatimonadaceae bacterium]|nr:dihydrolipoamide acetyltransferase family protein [Gemmatimonadaceae bacterium]